MLNQGFRNTMNQSLSINKLNANNWKQWKLEKGGEGNSTTWKSVAAKIQMQLYVFTDPQVFLALKPNSAESKNFNFLNFLNTSIIY